ncbi:MAG: hypothetical protein CM1200mP24_09220 [Gammaproteobacteria bacterium]|nr:MAG: hypothetical protein CM1200mP24_09220 [Gammaproteobacteria bacterium]
MDFALTEEQRMLQQSIEGFLETNCPLDAVRIAASSGSTRVTEIMAGLRNSGYLELSFRRNTEEWNGFF